MKFRRPTDFHAVHSPYGEVLYVAAISWLVQELLVDVQNYPNDVISTVFQNAASNINATHWIYTDGATGAAIFVNENTSHLCKLSSRL